MAGGERNHIIRSMRRDCLLLSLEGLRKRRKQRSAYSLPPTTFYLRPSAPSSGRKTSSINLANDPASLLPGRTLGLLADRFAATGISKPFRVDWLAGVNGLIRINGDVLDTKIHAKEIRRRGLGSVWDIDRHQQEPFAVLPENEMTLALAKPKAIRLILPHDEGDNVSPFKGRDADAIRPFETDVLAHTERDGRVLAEPGLPVLVPLVGFYDLGNAPNRSIGGKPEAFTQLGSGQVNPLGHSGGTTRDGVD